jgi:hypothetical protein
VKDVTEIFETYRECARHIRNTYFSTRASKDWNTIEDFEEVDDILFKKIIIDRVINSYSSHFKEIIENNTFLIVPNGSRMPLMISREKTGGYWDYPIEYLEPGDAEIAFRRYFDWDQHGLIDYRYYYGVILSSSKYPELAGHEVLIETIYGRIACKEN